MFSESEGDASLRHEFRFHPDRYPARPPYYDGSMRFKKHFYPLIHDLRDGGEEWQCAVAIEGLPEVSKWVRNIPQDRLNSFWLPTSTDYYYPDFVCELVDGRMLVVECKGGDRLDTADANEKARIGERWAATCRNRRCIFVQVSKGGPQRRSLEAHSQDAIRHT